MWIPSNTNKGESQHFSLRLVLFKIQYSTWHENVITFNDRPHVLLNICCSGTFCSPRTKLQSAFQNLWKLQTNTRSAVLAESRCRPTFHGFGVGLAAALTHRVEELVHLLQWQWVVQRLQRVDRGHHGAAFKPCSTDSGETETQPIVPLLHQREGEKVEEGDTTALCACWLFSTCLHLSSRSQHSADIFIYQLATPTFGLQ